MARLLNKSTKGVWLILCFVLLLSIVGCSRQDGTEKDSASGETANPGSGENITIGTEWKTAGFSYPEREFAPSEDTLPFQEIRGSVFEETKPEFNYTEKNSVVAYLRDTCYILYSYKQQQGQRFVLEKRRSDWEKPEQLELFGEPNQVPVGYVACMDVVTESDIAVLFVNRKGNWSGEVKEYLLLHLDGEGNIISQTELLASYQENGIESYDLVQDLWQCDEQGYSYVLTNERKTLTIFDATGNFVMCQDYSGKDDVTVETAFHAPDGSLIFSLSDAGQTATTLIWLDTRKKQWKELASIEYPYLKQFTMLENGQIYYSRGNSLIKWDVQTGRQETVISGLPVNMFEYVKHVSVTEQEELILYFVRRDRMDIRVLSDKLPETEGITLVDLSGISYVQSRIADYNRDNGGIQIQYKRSERDEEAFRTRTMMELATGKGPDMLCLWADDELLRTLYEKGVLADLTGLVPKETLDQVFPGVLAAGSVDGSLVGLGVRGGAHTLVTSNKLWQQDSWTVEDIMGIVETHPDLEGMLILENRTMWPSINLSDMGLKHMGNSPFVDFKNKKSHFEDMQFQEFLKLAKTYGEAPVPSGELSALIKDGRCMAILKNMSDPDKFVSTVEEYGEECHFIGSPGQTDYSGYWNSLYLIVVNKKSEYLDTIAEFLPYLQEPGDQQNLFDISVREDVVRQNVFWSEWSEEWLFGSLNGANKFTKPNGESYIEDYVEFLRKLGPMESSDAVISNIVSEEAEYYFNGAKSAEKVAEIIGNRVQMYLDE